MHEPNYAKYSLDDLRDALNHIDKERFPERVKVIEAEISKRASSREDLIPKIVADEEVAPVKSRSIFERLKITDLESAKKAIKKAWIASLVYWLILLFLTVLALSDVRFFLNEHLSSYNLVDVILVGGLTFGIYRRSRVSAILLEVYIYANYFYAWYKDGTANFSLLVIALLYFLFHGITGTFKYHQLTPKQAAVEMTYKFCPSCGDRNHVANVRCGCGYEFQKLT
jgi:hypothetical protein